MMASYAKNANTRRAALIHFKEGVSTEQAEKALRRIHEFLEAPITGSKPSFDVGAYVQEFDADCGGPVWYIP